MLLTVFIGACVGGGGGDNSDTPDTVNTSPIITNPTTSSLEVFAGSHAGFGSRDGISTEAKFENPSDIAIDAFNNIYVADRSNCTIRKITPDANVTTLAGSPRECVSTDGVGSAARFAYPEGIATDAEGNVYVAETQNNFVRKITPTGAVTTIAGAPHISNPTDITVDSAGNIFVLGSDRIQKITVNGVITTFYNLPTSGGWSYGITVDQYGYIYVASSTKAILKISPAGNMTILAGRQYFSGNSDGASTEASFGVPYGISVDNSGNLYVTDKYYNSIRKITPSGTVTTLAGAAGLRGSKDGEATVAKFFSPQGIAVANNGNIYIADTGNHNVRTISNTNVITTFAGPKEASGEQDGVKISAKFLFPEDLVSDSTGNVFVLDAGNFTIRKITPNGMVTTFAGMPGKSGHADGTGSEVRFLKLKSIAIDNANNLYVSDGDVIRKITPTAMVSTFAGTAGTFGSTDGVGADARFRAPNGLAADQSGNVYVADYLNHTIRKVSQAGVVTTIAGTVGITGNNDGTGMAARFTYPYQLAVDSIGNVYVTEWGKHSIRKISPVGTVTTIAGHATSNGNIDNTGTAARFDYPTDMECDHDGNLYLTDTGNALIRKITPQGVVSTVAGTRGRREFEGGNLPGALAFPGHLTLFNRTLYISTYHAVLRIENAP